MEEINNNELDNDGEGWTVEQMECSKCAHEWTAVYPILTQQLECTRCNHMNASQYSYAMSNAVRFI